MVTGTNCCANFAGPCLEIANMIYIDVYFKLWQFEHYPNRKLQKELIFAGYKGLWALAEEDEDTRKLWTRMFLLRMVFCLLGIGNKANLVENYTPSENNILDAEKFLEAISLEGIETRRAMFYWMAKSRLFEMQNLGEDCIRSIENAVQLAKKGHFKELKNIEDYADVMKHRYGQYEDTVSNTAPISLSSAEQLSRESRVIRIRGNDVYPQMVTESTRTLQKADRTRINGNSYKASGNWTLRNAPESARTRFQ